MVPGASEGSKDMFGQMPRGPTGRRRDSTAVRRARGPDQQERLRCLGEHRHTTGLQAAGSGAEQPGWLPRF